MTQREMFNALRDIDGYHLHGGKYDLRHVVNAIIRMLGK